MNTAAVKAWEQRQSSTSNNTSDKSRRPRRRRRRPGAHRDCTSTDTAVETRNPEPQHISETPSHKTNNSTSSNQNRATSRIFDQIHSHSTSNLPNIIVQVSQHSSLDRDLYEAYQSSLSTQGHSSLSLPHPDSGFRKTFHNPAPSPSYSNGVIPDSQSLPGSSSYQPPSSASLAVLGADQAPLIHQPQSCFTSNNPNLGSSTGGVVESDDSIEDSSGVVVATSQPSAITSRRSKSAPAPNTTVSLPHSTSDPTSAYHDQQRRRASEQPSDHHISLDQGIQRSADFQLPYQRGVRHTQQKSSVVQVPASSDRSSDHSHAVDLSPVHSLVLQTQVPLAFASQGSRVSITSAGSSSRPLILEAIQRRDSTSS